MQNCTILYDQKIVYSEISVQTRRIFPKIQINVESVIDTYSTITSTFFGHFKQNNRFEDPVLSKQNKHN